MKTSLIITTYNNPFYLNKVLNSVLVQETYPDEVIIADDGSTEETAGLVKALTEGAPFAMLHVWHEDMGFRAAKIRNEAIKQSSGEYIVILDGDCVVNRHFIADHLKLAEEGCFVQGKRLLVQRDAVDLFSRDSTNSSQELPKLYLQGKLQNIHHALRLPGFPAFKSRKLKNIKSCNMGFFRKDIAAVNGFNEDFVGWGNEDSELACRFFKYGLTKKIHPFMAVCFHLWHDSNKTPGSFNQKLLLKSIQSKEFRCRNGLIKLNAKSNRAQ